MKLSISTVNIGSPDPSALAQFYVRLLGYTVSHEEPGFVILRSPDGGIALSFQEEVGYVPPMWPARDDAQQMQLHLEIHADELEPAMAHALDCGATLADAQPQDDVRVCLDPDGHPFCLWVDT